MEKKIKATFPNDCMVLADGRVIAEGIEYDYAVRIVTENGGVIFQKFMDEDGDIGMIRKPYNCSRVCRIL